MTVNYLIRFLAQYPGDSEVMVRLPYSKLYRRVDDVGRDSTRDFVVIMADLAGDEKVSV